MELLTLIISFAFIFISGILVEKQRFGPATTMMGFGIILGMVFAAQMVSEVIIRLHLH